MLHAAGQGQRTRKVAAEQRRRGTMGAVVRGTGWGKNTVARSEVSEARAHGALTEPLSREKFGKHKPEVQCSSRLSHNSRRVT